MLKSQTNISYDVGFEVLTDVVLKSTIFWNITPCNTLSVNRRFGGTCRLHLQGGKISQARNQRACYLLSRWFLARHILRPWRWMRHTPPKRRLTANGRSTRRYIPEDSTLQIFLTISKIYYLIENNKFWEELIAYFPWYDTGHNENDASNNSFIVAYVFVTAVTFLPSRCQATIEGILPTRCLATIGEILPSRCLATIGRIHRHT
jgi:hypothetical protein